jgi:hypothetical protein
VKDGLATLEPLLAHTIAMIRGGRSHPEPKK